MSRGTLRVAVQGWCALRPLAAGTQGLGLALREQEDAGKPTAPGDGRGRGAGTQLRCALLGAPPVGQAVTLRLAGEESAWMVLTQVDVVQSTVPGELPELVLGGQAWKVVPADALVAAWGASGAEQVAQRLRVQLQVREGQAPAAESVPLRMTHAGERGQGSVGGLADALAFPLASPPAEGEALWLPVAELVGFEPQLAPYPSRCCRWNATDSRTSPGACSRNRPWRPTAAMCSPTAPRHCVTPAAFRARAARHARAVRQRRPRADGRVHAAGRARCGPPGWTPVPDVEPWTELDPQPEPPAEMAQGFIDCGPTAAAPAFQRGADPDPDGPSRCTGPRSFPAPPTAWRKRPPPSPRPRLSRRKSATLRRGRQAFRGLPLPRARHARCAPRGWSAPVRIELGRPGFQTRPWQSQDLLSIHRLMLRCAAGRGDVLAVLTLPAHYDRKQAAAHAQALRDSRPHAQPDTPPVIGADEGRALSHGALYHPGW